VLNLTPSEGRGQSQEVLKTFLKRKAQGPKGFDALRCFATIFCTWHMDDPVISAGSGQPGA
jgi:hypothetical protein